MGNDRLTEHAQNQLGGKKCDLGKQWEIRKCLLGVKLVL